MAAETRPAWAVRMLNEREARGWSQARAVANLRTTFSARNHKEGGSQESLLRQWKDWESGRVKPQHWAPYIAEIFGTVAADLFPESRPAGEPLLVAEAGMDTAELVARLRSSTVDASTLHALRVTADRLCTDYRHRATDDLREEGHHWLRQVTGLLDERLTYKQHGEMLSLAATMALLVGCVEYDAGDRIAAETTRQFALELGTEVDDRDIMGWAHEMSAWFALTAGDYHRVVSESEHGIQVAGQRGVSVQLSAQIAKAWARLGNRRKTETALDKGRDTLETLPRPSNPDHHFQIDPAKWHFYEMDAYRNLGDDRLAVTYAEEVLRLGTPLPGEERSPMRNAEARVTLAVAAVRSGDIEAALDQGNLAFDGARRSLPSLAMVSKELAAEMTRAVGDSHPGVSDYLDRLRESATAL